MFIDEASGVRATALHPVITDWKFCVDYADGSCPWSSRMFDDWHRNRLRLVGNRWPTIREKMEQFVHWFIYEVKPSDIVYAVRHMENPFGGTTGRDADVAGVNNLTTSAPINLTIHHLAQTIGHLPSFSDLERRLKDRPDIILADFAAHYGISPDVYLGDWLLDPRTRALRFRLAAAFNSWIRELHLMSTLIQECGLPIRHHFLLDAEWKQDFSCGNKVVELFIENSKYKNGASRGRKKEATDVNPLRDVIRFPIRARREAVTYNQAWLVDPEAIERLARQLS